MISKNIKLLILLLCTGHLAALDVILELPDGSIRGRTETTITDTTFYSFQGIPFAAPPVNELRFQAPQPVQPWDDVLDATQERNICYQVTHDDDNEDEDCLFINVFTPQDPIAPTTLLPVMFFIYGGGFVEGSSDSVNYGPQHLMDYGVIVITSNYRVGPFGFFSTGDDAIPGNAGLKDQNMALQWVQKNIEYFGGDPEKVTIFGESAGSASVAYQILSSKSAGLFRGAICESGSALSPWAYQRNQTQITYQTAAYIDPTINSDSFSSSELLEYLQSLPARTIDAASNTMANTESVEYNQIQQGFFYAPVVEHEHDGAFISRNQYDLLESGDINKVPLVIGFNSEESMFMTQTPDYLSYQAQYIDQNPRILVPLDMHLEDEETINRIANDIKLIYTETSFEDNPRNLVKYFSDQSFIRSIIKHAELQSQLTDVFFYRFAYKGRLGNYIEEPVEGFSDSVSHGEELGYLFRRNWGGYNTTDLSQYPESDVLVFRRFITLFTNFAKTLNPTPEADELLENILWPRVNPVYFPYLDIGSYSQVKLHPRDESYPAWEVLYSEYAVQPFDTY